MKINIIDKGNPEAKRPHYHDLPGDRWSRTNEVFEGAVIECEECDDRWVLKLRRHRDSDALVQHWEKINPDVPK